jgi:large subunit ribosomal protein L3
MPLGLIGKKLGMTRLFDEATQAMIPVTVVDVQGNTYLQHKTAEKEGYKAVQVGFDDQKKVQRVNKADMGHFTKAGSTPKRKLQEFRLRGSETIPDTHPGAELFTAGQFVDVIGTSKGHGFTGVVKRYKFGGLRMTHGSMMHRRTGAIGCRSTPGRVWKNQKMPGQDGAADAPKEGDAHSKGSAFSDHENQDSNAQDAAIFWSTAQGLQSQWRPTI